MKYFVNETMDISGRKYCWSLEQQGATYNAFSYKSSVEMDSSAWIAAARKGISLFSAGKSHPLLVDSSLSEYQINVVVVALGCIPEEVQTFEGNKLNIDLGLATQILADLKSEQEKQEGKLGALKKEEMALCAILMKKGSVKKPSDKKRLEEVREARALMYKAISHNQEVAKQDALDKLSKLS